MTRQVEELECILPKDGRRDLPSQILREQSAIDPVGTFIRSPIRGFGKEQTPEGSVHVPYLLPGGLFCGYHFEGGYQTRFFAGRWDQAGMVIRLTGVGETPATCCQPADRFATFLIQYIVKLTGNRLKLIGTDGSGNNTPSKGIYFFAGRTFVVPKIRMSSPGFSLSRFDDLAELAANILHCAEEDGFCLPKEAGFYIN